MAGVCASARHQSAHMELEDEGENNLPRINERIERTNELNNPDRIVIYHKIALFAALKVVQFNYRNMEF